MSDSGFTFSFDGGLGHRPRESIGDEPFERQLAAAPTLYPLDIDLNADSVDFLRLSEAEYNAASFLDSRLLTAGGVISRLRWASVRSAATELARRCHFIFHISHVGSTLLSRLLGHHPAFFSLREPAILRKCAEIHDALGRSHCPWSRTEFDDRMAVFLSLWSRIFHRDQTAVIKATSFVSEMAEYLLEKVADARAICMFVQPQTFLTSLLGGAMSDVTSKVEQRLGRLHRRLGGPRWRMGELSAGECVAMSWLCEMLALHAAASKFPERVMWIDFDRFLQSPQTYLAACFRHLGVSENLTVQILSGPTMSQYAKAPAQKFDCAVRNQLLQRDEVRHAPEIRRGMEFLQRAVTSSPGVGNALEAIEQASRQTKS